MIKYRGRKIKARDKNLVFKFYLSIILFIFVFTFFSFYFTRILSYDWQNFNFFSLSEYFKSLDYVYLIICFSVAVVLSFVFIIIYMKMCKKSCLKRRHRQALCRMILSNGWYETESYNDGFFTTGTASSVKKHISWFPKIYYRLQNSRIYISVRSNMGKAQDSLLSLEKKIETGLFCEFIEFTANEPYYNYVFYYDMAQTRINVRDLTCTDGGIELMQGFTWRYDKLPHALIVGSTGSGKSYFILSLIYAFAQSNADITVLDPKNADLADLAGVMPHVYHTVEDISFAVSNFAEEMLARSAEMKLAKNYITGSNYASLGLEPHFLIFDEYVAFFEMLNSKQVSSVMSDLKRIAMLGRQVGYFLILACQRADAKFLGDGIRDQFHFRLALGRNSELGYKMIFGDVEKRFLTMPAGRGYVDMGTNVISEFYAPFVPTDFDFLREIGRTYIVKGPVNPAEEEND